MGNHLLSFLVNPLVYKMTECLYMSGNHVVSYSILSMEKLKDKPLLDSVMSDKANKHNILNASIMDCKSFFQSHLKSSPKSSPPPKNSHNASLFSDCLILVILLEQLGNINFWPCLEFHKNQNSLGCEFDMNPSIISKYLYRMISHHRKVLVKNVKRKPKRSILHDDYISKGYIKNIYYQDNVINDYSGELIPQNSIGSGNNIPRFHLNNLFNLTGLMSHATNKKKEKFTNQSLEIISTPSSILYYPLTAPIVIYGPIKTLANFLNASINKSYMYFNILQNTSHFGTYKNNLLSNYRSLSTRSHLTTLPTNYLTHSEPITATLLSSQIFSAGQNQPNNKSTISPKHFFGLIVSFVVLGASVGGLVIVLYRRKNKDIGIQNLEAQIRSNRDRPLRNSIISSSDGTDERSTTSTRSTNSSASPQSNTVSPSSHKVYGNSSSTSSISSHLYRIDEDTVIVENGDMSLLEPLVTLEFGLYTFMRFRERETVRKRNRINSTPICNISRLQKNVKDQRELWEFPGYRGCLNFFTRLANIDNGSVTRNKALSLPNIICDDFNEDQLFNMHFDNLYQKNV